MNIPPRNFRVLRKFQKTTPTETLWHGSCKMVATSTGGWNHQPTKNDMNFQHSNRGTACATHIADCESDPTLQLATQIQSLVSNPGLISPTPDRSVLFQVAAHLAIPPLPGLATPGPTVTCKIFADVRQEALHSGRKKNYARAKVANRRGSEQRFQF